MGDLSAANRKLWLFSWFKIPLIGICRPKITELSAERIVVRIPLNLFTRNHLGSMYLGVLSIGADLAAGFHAFYLSEKRGRKVSLAFKNFSADFISRPNSAVYFICEQGEVVSKVLEQTKTSGERVTIPIKVQAVIHYPENPELVAEFTLGLSLKDKGSK